MRKDKVYTKLYPKFPYKRAKSTHCFVSIQPDPDKREKALTKAILSVAMAPMEMKAARVVISRVAALGKKPYEACVFGVS